MRYTSILVTHTISACLPASVRLGEILIVGPCHAQCSTWSLQDFCEVLRWEGRMVVVPGIAWKLADGSAYVIVR